jgi:hypothetical protein
MWRRDYTNSHALRNENNNDNDKRRKMRRGGFMCGRVVPKSPSAPSSPPPHLTAPQQPRKYTNDRMHCYILFSKQTHTHTNQQRPTPRSCSLLFSSSSVAVPAFSVRAVSRMHVNVPPLSAHPPTHTVTDTHLSPPHIHDRVGPHHLLPSLPLPHCFACAYSLQRC